MTDTNFENWKARAKAVPIARVVDVRALGLKRVGAELIGPCPKCGGTDRFSINPGKGVFNCRGCNAAGDCIALTMLIEDCTFAEACEKITGEPAPRANGRANGKDHDPPEKVTDAYYCDNAGETIFAVNRVEHGPVDAHGKRAKRIRQWRPDPANVVKRLWNLDGIPPLIYKLQEVTEAIANNHPVIDAEGEPCCNRLWDWGIAETTNPGGAGKWKPEHSAFLKGADVVLLPDNDDQGWQHANDVATSLRGIAKSIKVVVLPHVRAKDDVVDWARRGGTREQLNTLIAAAQDWKFKEGAAPPDDEEKKKAAEASETELIAKLAEMPDGIPKARERKRLAKQLNVSRRDIDEQVRTYQEDKAAAPLFGHWAVEPAADPVDGDSLLRDIIRRIQRHVVIDHSGALVIALWLMTAWVHETCAVHSPILNINSSEPESGKSTAMGLVSFLMPCCIASVEASEAAIYRAIERWAPSFCFDEFDSVLIDDTKAALRSVINSGHTRGTGVLRCVGDDRVPQLFKTFAPKAIAMNGRKLPPATLSRCIFVELRRRTKGEIVIEPFKHEDDPGLADLRSRLRRWSMDNEEALLAARPAMPAELSNRRADNWALLLKIADLCDGVEGYGDQARVAAVRIESEADSQTITIKLLADCKAVRELPAHKVGAVISSATLVAELVADKASIWAEFKRGKELTQAALARMLGKHRILARNVRPEGEPQAKGYHWHDFEEHWARYL
jgi:hypothetical protein